MISIKVYFSLFIMLICVHPSSIILIHNIKTIKF